MLGAREAAQAILRVAYRVRTWLRRGVLRRAHRGRERAARRNGGSGCRIVELERAIAVLVEKAAKSNECDEMFVRQPKWSNAALRA